MTCRHARVCFKTKPFCCCPIACEIRRACWWPDILRVGSRQGQGLQSRLEFPRGICAALRRALVAPRAVGLAEKFRRR
eukprot:3822107-Pyramimonas_sp.AAC.1